MGRRPTTRTDVVVISSSASARARAVSSGTDACVLVGGMTLAVPGATGFVALAQRAVIGTSARIAVRTFGRNSMMGR
jgi:hypothetical protein